MKKGFTLIEVIIAAVIISTIMISIIGLSASASNLSFFTLQESQAQTLLNETVEAVKLVRDDNWSNISSLSTSTNYYPSFSGSAWTLTTTPNPIGIFTQKIVFQNVNRDSNDDIVSSGGTLDTGTRKVTATVSWLKSNGTQASESIIFLIADIRS